MLGRYHLSLSLISGFIISYSIFNDINQLFFIFMMGIYFGSLFPDIDTKSYLLNFNQFSFISTSSYKLLNFLSSSKKETYNRFQTIKLTYNLIFIFIPISSYILKYLIYNPIIFISIKIFFRGFEIKNNHRVISHTIYSLFVFSILFLILSILIFENLYLFYGFVIGFIFHLIQDSTTIMGVNYTYPFFNLKFSGKLYTSYKSENIYENILVIVLLSYLFSLYFYNEHLLEYNILILVLIWFLFLVIVGVKITNKEIKLFEKNLF